MAQATRSKELAGNGTLRLSGAGDMKLAATDTGATLFGSMQLRSADTIVMTSVEQQSGEPIACLPVRVTFSRGEMETEVSHALTSNTGMIAVTHSVDCPVIIEVGRGAAPSSV
jgi:hypothetical protein